jgi:hypothetical protein
VADPNAYVVDLLHDTLIPLGKAHLLHPGLKHGRHDDRPVSRATLERWRTSGVPRTNGPRVKLPTALVGAGRRITSLEALTWFFDQINGRSGPPTAQQTRVAHERAERELESAGW